MLTVMPLIKSTPFFFLFFFFPPLTYLGIGVNRHLTWKDHNYGVN